jgi:hypothetical protein
MVQGSIEETRRLVSEEIDKAQNHGLFYDAALEQDRRIKAEKEQLLNTLLEGASLEFISLLQSLNRITAKAYQSAQNKSHAEMNAALEAAELQVTAVVVTLPTFSGDLKTKFEYSKRALEFLIEDGPVKRNLLLNRVIDVFKEAAENSISPGDTEAVQAALGLCRRAGPHGLLVHSLLLKKLSPKGSGGPSNKPMGGWQSTVGFV